MAFLSESHIPAVKLAFPVRLNLQPMLFLPIHADGYCRSAGTDLGLSITCEGAYVCK